MTSHDEVKIQPSKMSLIVALFNKDKEDVKKALKKFDDPNTILIEGKTPVEYLWFQCEQLPRRFGNEPDHEILSIFEAKDSLKNFKPTLLIDKVIVEETQEELSLYKALEKLNVNKIIECLQQFEDGKDIKIAGKSVTDFFLEVFFQNRTDKSKDELGAEIWEMLWLKTNPKDWEKYLEVRDSSVEGHFSGSERASPVEKTGEMSDDSADEYWV